MRVRQRNGGVAEIRTVLLVQNPSAGGGGVSEGRLRDAFSEFHVHHRSTEEGPLAREDAAECHLIVVAGGDGTVASALKALGGADLPFAIVPLGTANNVATSLGIAGPPEAIARGLRDAKPRGFDLGALEGLGAAQTFVEAVGVGALSAALSEPGKASFPDRRSSRPVVRRSGRSWSAQSRSPAPP